MEINKRNFGIDRVLRAAVQTGDLDREDYDEACRLITAAEKAVSTTQAEGNYPVVCQTKEQLEAWAAQLLFSGNKLGEPLMAFFNAWNAESRKLKGATLEQAARVCEKRAEERFQELGTTEHDTGASYYSGRGAEEYGARDEEDESCAAEIRALKEKP